MTAAVLPRRTIKPPDTNQILAPEERVRWDLIVVAIGLGILALDQFTKSLVLNHFAGSHRFDIVPVFGNVLTFIYLQNTGTAFSLLEASHAIYVIIPAAIGLIVWLYISLRPRNSAFIKVMFGLVLGGALGNLLDRLRLGFVVDFIHFQVPGLHFDWYVFNVADSAIVVGMLSLSVVFFLLPREPESQPADPKSYTGPSGATSTLPGKLPTDVPSAPKSIAKSPPSSSTKPSATTVVRSISAKTPVAVGSAKAASKARRQHHA